MRHIGRPALHTSTTFGGDVSGKYNATVVADDSHNHIVGNVDGLQTALDAKVSSTSPTFTGDTTISTNSADYKPVLDIKNINAGAYAGLLKFTSTYGATAYTPAQIRAYGGTGSSDGELAFETAGSERLRIDGSGRVGINTDPSDKLQVKGAISSEATNSTNRWMTYTHTDNTYRVNYNGAGNDEVIIDSSGNTGIGTAPASGKKLHVNGDTQIDGSLVTSSPITSTGQFLGRKVITFDDNRDTDTTYYKILLPQTYSENSNGGHVKLTMIWRGEHASSSATKIIEFSYGTHHSRSSSGYLTLSPYTLIHDSETENSYGSYDITPGFALYRGVVENSNGDCGAILKVTGRHSSYNKRFHLRAEITGDTKRASTITDMGSSLESGAVAMTQRTVWNTSNDGSGSGLDADLLDGNHGSHFLNAGNLNAGTVPVARMNKVLPTSGNYVWNNSTTAGNYTTGLQCAFVSSSQGFPQYGSVLHVGARGGSDAGGDFQIYCGHGSGHGGNYLRVRNADNSASPSDSWTGWRTIWDSGNDGSGSGLDADTVDGVHASNIGHKQGLSYYRHYTWIEWRDTGAGLYWSNSTGSGWHIYPQSSSYMRLRTGSGSGGIRCNTAGSDRNYIYWNTSNEVGFLNTSGSWAFRCDNSGNVTATGNVTAYSDIRLKTDIEPIESALERVSKLQGIEYTRKSTGVREMGFIAQDVIEHEPTLVDVMDCATTEDESLPDMHVMKYQNTVALLVEAIKEQQTQINELKTKVS